MPLRLKKNAEMKTKEEILNFAKWRSFNLSDYAQEAILAAMEEYSSQFKPIEMPCSEPPSNNRKVWTDVGVCQYAKAHQIPIDDIDPDNREYDEIEEKNGEYYLKEGWYELCQQSNGDYDEIWMLRKPQIWTELPVIKLKAEVK